MSEREYPDRPFVGVGALVIDGDRVLVVKRGAEPLKGSWSLPGGAVEAGETLEACVHREIAEETGLRVEVGPVIEVLDRITLDDGGRVRYHFVLIDYLCWSLGGEARAGSDVDEVQWAAPEDLQRYSLPAAAMRVIARGLELARQAPRTAR